MCGTSDGHGVGEGLFQGEEAVGGLGILFFPKLLCPGDPRAGQEQLQRTTGADTEQGPARGERSGCGVSNSSGDSSQKISGSGKNEGAEIISSLWLAIGLSRSFSKPEGLLEAFSKP